MPVEQAQFFCVGCQQNRLFTRQGSNNLVHALVSLFLCGLWIPVWILASMNAANAPYFCSQCGLAGNAATLSDPYGKLAKQKAERREERREKTAEKLIEYKDKAAGLLGNITNPPKPEGSCQRCGEMNDSSRTWCLNCGARL